MAGSSIQLIAERAYVGDAVLIPKYLTDRLAIIGRAD